VLVVSVDVVLGPLITFAVFDRAKPRRELRRDLVVVGLLQLAGLLYGLWTVHLARPVHMVFEIDRFRVVHQIDIPLELEEKRPAGIDVAPWGGPTLIATRPSAARTKISMPRWPRCKACRSAPGPTSGKPMRSRPAAGAEGRQAGHASCRPASRSAPLRSMPP
jgi:hypothetical protein